MTTTFLLIGLFLLGVLLNAFFAGYETGFVGSNPIRIRHLAEEENDPRAKRLLIYMEHPDRMISVVLLGTNIALVMGTLAITEQVGSFWATIIATPMFLVLAEIVPKSMFRVHPNRAALLFFPLIRFSDAILTPLVLPVTWLSQGLLALVGAEKRDIRRFMTTLEDMRVLVDESAEQGTIEPEEQDMIHSIMDLQSRHAREIMVPRIDIQALPDTATRQEVIELFKESGRTRLPIYRDNIDHIIGVVNAFDILRDENPEEQNIERFIKEPLHVPDTMRLDDLLRAMREEKQSMAILTDEYGGTDGLICVEDILEEIFGEIHDEYDIAETPFRKVAPNAFVIDARMPLEDAAGAMEVPLKDDDVDTVGGWIMHVTNRIPNPGEVIEENGFRITILEGGPNNISRVRVEIIYKPEPTDAGESSPREGSGPV